MGIFIGLLLLLTPLLLLLIAALGTPAVAALFALVLSGLGLNHIRLTGEIKDLKERLDHLERQNREGK